MSVQPSVLVVEADPALAKVACAVMGQEAIGAEVVASDEAALAHLGHRHVDVLLLGTEAPGREGPQRVRRLRGPRPDLPVVLAVPPAALGEAVAILREPAADFVVAPFERDGLLYAIRKALALARHANRLPPPSPLPSRLVGVGESMGGALQMIQRAAGGTATVLLCGEAGTGKDLAARHIHASGSRGSGPFVHVSCAALPDSFLEAELFGYEQGAFPGASTSRPGRVELAQGGTLYLDDLSEVSPILQVKLLRLLQDRTLERMGSQAAREVDVRFIAASRQDLRGLVAQGRFREDLYYRLNVIGLELPPLRKRREDIVPLARHFAEAYAALHGRSGLQIEDAAFALLEGQSWSGNVRQLEAFVERLVVLCEETAIDVPVVERELTRAPLFAAMAERQAKAGGNPEVAGQLQAAERRSLSVVLERTGGDRLAAARILGVGLRTLNERMQAHDLLDA